MKDYKVKVLFDFNDTEEKTEVGTDTPRRAGDIFNCTKERYEALKKHNAVMLVGIDEKEEKTEKKEVVEISKPKNEEEHIRIGKTKLSKAIKNKEEVKEEKPKKKGRKKIDTAE